MMDQEDIQEIIQKLGTTGSGRTYQFKINRKKIVVAEREGLESDEEEVEDLHAVENIEEIMHAIYEINIRGEISNEEEGTPVQIRISVKPTTPCMINTSTKKELFREKVIENHRNLVDQNISEGTSGSTENNTCSGTSGSTSSNTSGSSSPNNNTQIVVLRGAGTTHSTMEGVYPMIILPKFHGDGSKDPDKHLFVCERIWEVKRVNNEVEKVAQLEIMFRNRALDWYMSLAVKNP
jgi:hypothetical protein